MTSSSEKFEQQIYKIHNLLEKTKAKVIWNDRILDPDNPEQLRQIDVSIKKNNKLTIIECRIHKSKQDVKWIEELIGRKASLKADALIAVSASGFTRGAILKAEKFGIILRDILSLTEDEIRNWGSKTDVWLTFYEYSKVEIELIFSAQHRQVLKFKDLENYLRCNREKLYSLFETISKTVDDQNISGKTALIRGELLSKDIKINGVSPEKIIFSTAVKSRDKHLNIASVVVYDSPEIDALERNVFIEAVELGDFEITQSNDSLSVALDLSQAKIPKNCHFRSVKFDFKRVVSINTISIVGLPKFYIPLSGFNLKLDFR